jgi:hypothetical protein
VSRASTAAANDSGDLDQLWSVPPEKFVAARNAAIAELRAAGDAKSAAALKAVKRPSPSAWLVNALVRGAPKEIDAIFRAGDALIAAQGRVLGGADPDEMHAAMRGVREAIGRAMSRARAILAEHGRKPTADLNRRVMYTLRSASLDRRLRDVVLAGRLTSDPSVDEVEALAEVRVPPRVAQKRVAKKKAAKKAEKPRVDRAAKQRAQREERAAKQAKAREERETKQRAAREARDRLRAEAAEAAAAADEARRAVARAETEERRARAAAEEAKREVQRARRALTTAHEKHARSKKRAR